jgi:hypothetical protein
MMDLGPECSIVTRFNTRRDAQASVIQSPPALDPRQARWGQRGRFITLPYLRSRIRYANNQGAPLIESLAVNPGKSAMTIAVTGATGQLGRLVIDRLKAKAGEAIVAFVRSPANARGLGVAFARLTMPNPRP